MTSPNRELSQFTSFLSINDVTKNVAITTSSTPYVGIGTTTPTEKLDVQGNIKASGIVTATAFYGDGSTLQNVVGVIQGSFINTSGGIWTGASLGIGTSGFSYELNVNGSVGVASTVYARSIELNAPNGVPPLVVQSTTIVPNLNASFLAGRPAPGGNIVGDSDIQILSNKTLSNPRITTIINGSAIIGLPTTDGTLINTGSVGVITSGLYASGSISNVHISGIASIAYSKLNLSNSIKNSDVAAGAAISYSKLNLANSIKSSDIDPNNKIQNDKLQNSTISGVSLGSGLNQLRFGNYFSVNYLNVGDNVETLTGLKYYNGEFTTDLFITAYSENIGSSLVARDVNGSFTAGDIKIRKSNPSLYLRNLINYSAGINCFGQFLTIFRGGVDSETPIDSGVSPNSHPLMINLANKDIIFGGNGTFSGSVTATSFVPTSDYRLKENIKKNEKSSEIIEKLNVYEYNFKSEPNQKKIGWIAHEVQEVLPEAVVGEKDAVVEIGTLYDYNGDVLSENIDKPEILTYNETIVDPETKEEIVIVREKTWKKTGEREVYQGIDTAAILAVVCDSLKEALAEIKNLKKRVAELENIKSSS